MDFQAFGDPCLHAWMKHVFWQGGGCLDLGGGLGWAWAFLGIAWPGWKFAAYQKTLDFKINQNLTVVLISCVSMENTDA